jgi:hypothetical protein
MLIRNLQKAKRETQITLRNNRKGKREAQKAKRVLK